MFELSLKGRVSVCLVKKGRTYQEDGKNIWKQNIQELVYSMYERVIDKEAVRVGCLDHEGTCTAY